jgi:hypothetical protein
MAELVRLFRLLNAEQKAAAVGSLLLAVSTFGPFSFVEVAEILVAGGVLALLRARALGRRFHLPFGDGAVIAAAGIWAAALIVVRLFDRPLGQNLLALACAAILILAGLRERAKRPPDDLPAEGQRPPAERESPAAAREPPNAARPPRGPATPAARRQAPPGDEPPRDGEETEPLPPPEFKPYEPEAGEQLRLGGEQRPQPPADA